MRAEVGLTKRRWAAFIEESWPTWASFDGDDDENADDGDDLIGASCASDIEDQSENDRDPNYHPFGMLELPPGSGVVGAQAINELLECVRIRRATRTGDDIRRLRAHLSSLRCDCARDCAVHDMVLAIADYALGEHEGLAERVSNARRMFDDAFMMTGAMMIAMGTGELATARLLALEAMVRFRNNPMVLLQAGRIFQLSCEFRAAVETLSVLFDIAEDAGASTRAKESLAYMIRDTGDLSVRAEERGLDERLLGRRVEFACAMARGRGHAILGVRFRNCSKGSEVIEIDINAGFDECNALYLTLCDELVERFGYEAYDLILIACRSALFASVVETTAFFERSSECL